MKTNKNSKQKRNEGKMVNDILTKEETKEKQKKEKKKLPKEISQEILKKMFGNLLRAVGIMLYFIILNLAYSTMKQERLIGDIEVFAGAFLIVGIVLLEMAYKRDNGSIAISGIECLFLSLHSLSIMHVITLFKYDFRFYLLTSSYIFSIYYVLKAIVLYTKGRREYLKSLSDISEIVKKDEPVIKEAKKRNVNEEEKTTNQIKKKKPEAKKKNRTKMKTESKTVKKKITSKNKSETLKATKEENTDVNKKKTKAKAKTLKEEETPKIEKEITKSKNKIEKEEKAKGSKAKKEETVKGETGEIKTPEKKKRGRSKKEVSKND